MTAAANKRRRTLGGSDEPSREELNLMKTVTGPHVGSAMVMLDFAEPSFGDLSLNGAMHFLKKSGEAVNGGDLSAVEAMLASQAVALNTVFAEMARRAALNLGQHVSVPEAYMRLAFKAQNQCRMTLETLAAIKNPPTVFTRQANIANGPQQVVNNGVPTTPGARESLPAPSKLLEVENAMDSGAAGTAAAGDPALATVGEIDGAKDADGEGTRGAEPLQGRASARAAIGDARASGAAGLAAARSGRYRSGMRRNGEDEL